MEEYYIILRENNGKTEQVDFGNPQIFEQGIAEARKRGWRFDAFIVQYKGVGKIKLLPWS